MERIRYKAQLENFRPKKGNAGDSITFKVS